ncbi:MAG: hypothetical protein RIG77_25245 [Cyclobacteriaceae bacterium]
MKYLITPVFLFFMAFEARAQDEFTNNWNAANNLVEEMKYAEALEAFAPLLAEQPCNVGTHIQVGWCHLMLGDMEKAMEHAFTSYQLDQLYFASSTICAYVTMAGGQSESGKVFLDKSIWLIDDVATLDYYDEDIAEMEDGGLNVAALREEFENVKTNFGSINKEWASIYAKLTDGIALIGEGNFDDAKIILKEALKGFDKAPEAHQSLGFVTAYVIGSHYYSAGDSTNYMPVLNGSFDYMTKNLKTNYLPIIHMATMLAEHYYINGQYDKSFEVISVGLEYLPHLNNFTYLTYYKAMFLTQYSLSANAIGNTVEAQGAAELLTKIEWTGYDEWYQTNGWIYLAQAEADAGSAREYYQTAFNLAEQHGFEDLKNSVAENLK